VRYITPAVVGCGAGWWFLDSSCGVGVSAGTWFDIYPFVLRSQYQWGAFLPVDMYMDVVHLLSLWGEIKSVYLPVVYREV
jgi:hypothetical protein